MLKRVFLAVAFVLVAGSAFAQQQVTSAAFFEWDISAPSLNDAQNYTYKYYDGAQITGTAFVGVSCLESATTAGTFTCRTAIPAFTPGGHTMRITASNLSGESGKSDPLAFVFVVTPAVPTGLRLK